MVTDAPSLSRTPEHSAMFIPPDSTTQKWLLAEAVTATP